MRIFISNCWSFALRRNLSSMRNFSFDNRKKICIVGSGPAGFYTAQHLLKNKAIEVDIFEKLPVPFGLIRYGVAPDHPDIKNVTNAFTKIASNERFRFFGNISVGSHITVNELLNSYDAVVLAFGADGDKLLDIPGEDLENVVPARSLVGWYTGHPDHMDVKVQLDTDVAVVIGNGNVAIDVSRILLRSIDELRKTDISENALEALSKSKIKNVLMVGRRGPLQAAFTIKEFREMTKLKGCNMIIDTKEVDNLPDVIPSLERPAKRLAQLMYDMAISDLDPANNRTFTVKFLRSPRTILSDNSGRVQACVFDFNKVEGTSKNSKVITTSMQEVIKCGLVIRSIGYHSVSIDCNIPFDKKKKSIPNVKGRVIGADGLYCSGWVKSGPIGVIISTMQGSYETGETILQDIDKGDLCRNVISSPFSLLDTIKKRGVKYTTFQDWLKIDKLELEKGENMGKSREKFYALNDMLQAVNL